MENRIRRLRARFEEEQISSLLVSSPANMRYLTGFSGSGILLISPEEEFLVTDFRFKEQAGSEAPGCEIRVSEDELFDELAKLPSEALGEKMGFESQHLSYKQHLELAERLPSVTLVPKESLIEDLSVVKDEDEIRRIRRAVGITDEVFQQTIPFVKPGISERELAAEIEYKIRGLGGEKPSFDTIVASGERSSMPHAVPSDRQLQQGDLVVMDFGTSFEGYASNMTRTVVVGSPTKEQRRIYEIVRRAQEEAIKGARDGITCSQLDKIARQIIEDAGYGPNFRHSLGHGVGLKVHDPPRVSWRDGRTLKAGMVITIEPGIYIPGWGGVRIEDVIVIKKGGCEDLTTAPKELIDAVAH